MSIELDLHPYRGTSWPKKKPVRLRARNDLSFRNWHQFYELLFPLPSKEIPGNVVLIETYDGERRESTTDPMSGERYRYLPASKLVAALNKAFKLWEPIKPGEQWYEEDRDTRKRYKGILNKLKRLPGRTPVILDWH